MKLSTRARYGLRALIDLGLHSEEEAVSIQSIAGRQNISVSYLEQLMAKLKRAGIVESIRGAQGGYRLGRPGMKFLWETFSVYWKAAWMRQTVQATVRESTCENADLCVARFVWKRINESITSAVDSLMLGELIEESRKIQDKAAK